MPGRPARPHRGPHALPKVLPNENREPMAGAHTKKGKVLFFRRPAVSKTCGSLITVFSQMLTSFLDLFPQVHILIKSSPLPQDMTRRACWKLSGPHVEAVETSTGSGPTVRALQLANHGSG